MKSFLTVLVLATSASAALLAPRVDCHAEYHASCPVRGALACEDNGGYLVSSPCYRVREKGQSVVLICYSSVSM